MRRQNGGSLYFQVERQEDPQTMRGKFETAHSGTVFAVVTCMCLAIPSRVVKLLDGASAIVDVGGIQKAVSTALLDRVDVGDFVIVHVGHALTRLDPAEAERTLQIFAECEAASDDP